MRVTGVGAPAPPHAPPSAARGPRALDSWVPVALLAAACVVVPGLYRPSWSDVFAAPKLGALWGVLCASLLVLAVLVGVGGTARAAMGRTRPATVLLLAWIAWNLAAFGWSIDRHQSLFGEHFWYQGLLTCVLYAGFFLVARLVTTTPARLALLAGAIACGGVYVSVVGLLQQMGDDPVFGIAPPGGRVFSTIGQPNSLGAYLVVAIAMTVALLGRPSPALRVAAGLALASMVTCLVLTDSRGGYLGFAAAAVVLIAAYAAAVPGRRVLATRLPALASLVAIILVAVSLYALVPPLRSRVDRTFDRAVSSTDTSGDMSNVFHLDLWHEAWRVTIDHPVVGTGQETFPDVFPSYARDLPPAQRLALSQYRVESPHDVYLAISAGAGFPALAAYLVLVGYVVGFVLIAARRASDGPTRLLLAALIAAIAGHLVTDAFMTADLTTSWLMWLLMGAGLGAASFVPSAQPACPGPSDPERPVDQVPVRSSGVSDASAAPS